MFLAVGSGAYVAAVFHMVTHAFFKALMFLGSGSVIHGMHDEQDMRRMGALRKFMPVTAVTFIIGWLAIAGVPPFAGFWSKDEILLFAYDKSKVLYAVGLLTAILTAYYMTRQVIMVFFGKPRWAEGHDHDDQHHGADAHGDDHGHGNAPHESPWIMLLPLVVLAGLSIVGGAMQLPFTDDTHFLEKWLHPVMHGEHELSSDAKDVKWILLGVAVVCALVGIFASIAVYAKGKAKPIEPKVLQEAWYVDKAYASVVGGPGTKAFDAITYVADAKGVDGIVNGSGLLVRGVGGQLRRLQTGFVRNYAWAVVMGAALLLGWFVFRGSM
jgi:NADH-quinone oxidoreductase subunit L